MFKAFLQGIKDAAIELVTFFKDLFIDDGLYVKCFFGLLIAGAVLLFIFFPRILIVVGLLIAFVAWALTKAVEHMDED